MSKTSFTKRKPKKEGYYWFRETPAYRPRMVLVGKLNGGSDWWMHLMHHDDNPRYVSEYPKALWAGPLQEPPCENLQRRKT